MANLRERECIDCKSTFQPSGPRSKRCAVCSVRKCSNCGEPVPPSRTGKTCSTICATEQRIRNLPPRICAFPACEREFPPATPSSYFCSEAHSLTCDVCENSFPVAPQFDPRKTCPACVKAIASEKRRASQKKTFQERYGVDSAFHLKEVQEKVIKTNEERYGVANQFQRPEVKKKIEEANLAKFGVPHAGQAEEVKAKIRASFLDRYGVDHPMRAVEVREKVEATMLERYGVGNAGQLADHREKIRATSLLKYGVPNPHLAPHVREKFEVTMLERYGVKRPLQLKEFLDKSQDTFLEGLASGRHSGGGRISKINRNWSATIEERFNVETTLEVRAFGSNLDIGIDGTNVVIDINPTFSHNALRSYYCAINGCDTPCEAHKQLPVAYHFDRAKAAQDAGYSFLQFYDWDPLESALQLISGKIERGFKRHSARKLTLEPISQRDANRFLKTSHIQGAARKQTHCYGLRSADGELLAVATFGPSRFGSKAEYEWVRYAVAPRTVIYGGPGRLFNRFLEDTNPASVVSYIDFNHTTAPVTFLNGLGFVEGKPTGPTLVWHNVVTGQRVPETSLLTLGADRILGTSYGSREESGLNNHQIMEIEGFLPIYTAGNRVFSWSP